MRISITWRRNPLDRGGPQEANPIRFGGDSPEANPIRCGEGESLEVNFIHLEKEKGTPLKRIPFAVERGGTPWGESHPLGEEGHLDRVGASMRRILFALEKGTPMKRIHR